MTSTPSTHSEGEIFTSDSEKATQTLRSHNGISVDRHTRTNDSSLRNSRSRSPYRAPRGEKRYRDDGHTTNLGEPDERRQKFRHDSDRYISDRSHGRRPRFDSDVGHQKRSHHAYDYEVDRRPSSKRPRIRSRTRSRSPYRHSRLEKQSTRSDDIHRNKLGGSKQDDETYRNGRGNRDGQSVSEQSRSSDVALAFKSNAKPPENQPSQTLVKQASRSSTTKYVLRETWQKNTD